VTSLLRVEDGGGLNRLVRWSVEVQERSGRVEEAVEVLESGFRRSVFSCHNVDSEREGVGQRCSSLTREGEEKETYRKAPFILTSC